MKIFMHVLLALRAARRASDLPVQARTSAGVHTGHASFGCVSRDALPASSAPVPAGDPFTMPIL
jgi:hypothetical protein